jgi:hypothetical protein
LKHLLAKLLVAHCHHFPASALAVRLQEKLCVAESTVAYMVLAKLRLTLPSWNVYCQPLLALPLAQELVH